MKLSMNKLIQVLTLIFIITACAKKKSSPFTFVQLCDTQLGMGGYEHDILSFEQAVKQINQLNPDFTVICGDLVNNPNDSSFFDFKRIVEGLNKPYYLALGNHDVSNTPTNKSLAFYRKTIGEDYFTFHNKGYSFVTTNTQLWKANTENESKKHHKWFVNTLDSLGRINTSTIVIGHYPLFIKNPEEEEEYFNLPVDIRMEILALFTKNNVKAYLSGHRHQLVVNNYENILLVSGETTSKNFDERPLGFRLWSVSSDTLSNIFVPLKEIDKIEN